MNKSNLTNCLLIIFLLILTGSCSIEKRVYSSGYHVKLKSFAQTSQKNDVINIKKAHVDSQNFIAINETSNDSFEQINPNNKVENDEVYASINNTNPIASSFSSSIVKNYKLVFTQECDNIILKNGEEISAKVIEVEETKIKYKKCENIEGPTYSINKEDVLLIQYVNGTRDVFNSSNTTAIDEVKSDEIRSEESKVIEPFSIVSLILGIAGIVIGLFASSLIGLILLILAIILGIIGNSRFRTNKYKGLAASIIGIVLGFIGIATLITLALV